jgi:hypothetical protein
MPIEDTPTPCCNIPRGDCDPWPTIEIFKLWKFVSDQDLDSLDGQRQAIIFLCITLEMLLEFSLRELLTIHTDSQDLVEAVLNSYHGRERLIELYKKLSDRPLGKLFESNKKLNTFLKDWGKIAEARNKIIHGGNYPKLHEAVELVPSILEKCLNAFAEVNNDIQRVRAKIP